VIDTGGRYPVNFYASFFPQDPGRPGRPRRWTVAKLTAIDAAGRPVATCPVEAPPDADPRCAGDPSAEGDRDRALGNGGHDGGRAHDLGAVDQVGLGDAAGGGARAAAPDLAAGLHE
jgi:hypothetical protein